MEFGVHLPQIPWDDDPVTLDGLITFATTAERLGFTTSTANDHLVYGRPWLTARRRSPRSWRPLPRSD